MGIMNVVFGRMLERRMAEYQNDLLTKHCDEVQHIYKTMRGWRHDYHNHMQTMLALLDADASSQVRLKDYLLKLSDDLIMVDAVIKTGNIMVDAILNSKLSLIQSKKIAIHAKAIVPPEIKISEIDLCVIIGNLLDNAMEACLKEANESKRFIRVFIGILKGELYISVTNAVGGEVKKIGKTYLSTKNSTAHGLGLMRIDHIVEKYHGYMNRQHEEGVFATEIMLPL